MILLLQIGMIFVLRTRTLQENLQKSVFTQRKCCERSDMFKKTPLNLLILNPNLFQVNLLLPLGARLLIMFEELEFRSIRLGHNSEHRVAKVTLPFEHRTACSDHIQKTSPNILTFNQFFSGNFQRTLAMLLLPFLTFFLLFFSHDLLLARMRPLLILLIRIKWLLIYQKLLLFHRSFHLVNLFFVSSHLKISKSTRNVIHKCSHIIFSFIC